MALPQIMDNAAVDLLATVEGRFSPDDWQAILARAESAWRAKLANLSERESWNEVVREFHRERYWGFAPNYRAPKVKKKENLGITLIFMTLNAMVTFKVLMVWFGFALSNNDDPKYKWIFVAIVFLILADTGYFLWRHRAYKD